MALMTVDTQDTGGNVNLNRPTVLSGFGPPEVL